MADASERIAMLSLERRKLLEHLLKVRAHEEAAARVPAEAAPVPSAKSQCPTPAAALKLEFSTSSEEVKQNFRRFYNGVSKQLDSSPFGQFSYFLNYGFVPDGTREFSTVSLPEKYINKNSVKLVLEVIGDCDLKGRRILDVGCGRGGMIQTIMQFFQPATVVGLDLSANAVHFCSRVHKYPEVSFREGDAESLPFPDSSFDVVTNLESSHTYPNISSFFSETDRVLAPAGFFLYADVMPREKSNHSVGILRQVGFTVEQDRDITNNVVLSCDEIAPLRTQVFHSGNDTGLVNNFLATPDSQVYQAMKNGTWVYRICRFRKGSPRISS
jgi:phthiocerol/phenolphthiocerol synthesis type-I polyketide synthase E